MKDNNTTPLPEAQPLEGVKTAEEMLNEAAQNLGHADAYDMLWTGEVSVNLPIVLAIMKEYATAFNAQFATDAGGGKETLSKAFSAGELFANDCRCGECDYCDLYPDKEPNFEEWYALTAPSTHSSSEMVEDDDFDDYDCLPGGHAAV